MGINNWFGRLQGSVFYDEDADGFRDPGEFGLPDQAVLLRFRDGTVYDATADRRSWIAMQNFLEELFVG